MSKNLTTYTNLKTILLDYQNNYVDHLRVNYNAVNNFDSLATAQFEHHVTILMV